MRQQLDPVVVVIPGDLHLTERGQPNYQTALWMAAEVNHLIRPDFVQFIGDNAQNARAEEYQLFQEITAQLKVPFHALAGDHDVHDDPQALTFRRMVGDPCGVLTLRGFRFLRLNTAEFRPQGLSDAQLGWFRKQVDEGLERGERIVIFQHHYPFQIWEDYYDGPGMETWHEIVHTRRITATFTGHTHYWQVANDGRNVTVATRSLGDPEGGPAGYTLVWLQGEDLAVTYRSVIDRGPVVLITHPREKLLATSKRHIVSGPNRIQVQTWSEFDVKAVRGRIDDGAWFDLTLAVPGIWDTPLAGERLAKGEHTLEVRAVDTQGGEGGQRIGFMVDPTGRYTAVPMVRPVVTETAFC